MPFGRVSQRLQTAPDSHNECNAVERIWILEVSVRALSGSHDAVATIHVVIRIGSMPVDGTPGAN